MEKTKMRGQRERKCENICNGGILVIYHVTFLMGGTMAYMGPQRYPPMVVVTFLSRVVVKHS